MPYWLSRLEEHKESLGRHTPDLKRMPSEIFREQSFVSIEADEKEGLEWICKKDLLSSILWGSDYPHYDSTYPGAYQEAQETISAVGRQIAIKVVNENPTRFLRLQCTPSLLIR